MVTGEAVGVSRPYLSNHSTGRQMRRHVINHVGRTNFLCAEFFRNRRQRGQKAIGDKPLDADRAEGWCQIVMRAACLVRAESHSGTGDQVCHLKSH